MADDDSLGDAIHALYAGTTPLQPAELERLQTSLVAHSGAPHLAPRRRSFSMAWAAAAVAAAALFVIGVAVGRSTRGGFREDLGGAAVRTSRESTEHLITPVSFELRAPTAREVYVVGDFNKWNAKANPLVKDGATGAWKTLVPLRPGLHVYAFIIVGTVWTVDPRSTRAGDDGFGTPNSAILVGGRS
jgi:hypothetical protein